MTDAITIAIAPEFYQKVVLFKYGVFTYELSCFPRQVIFAIGRDACTSSIGLDKVGVKLGK